MFRKSSLALLSDNPAGAVLEGAEHLSPVQLKEARRFAVQFIYQLEITQQLFFHERSYEVFCEQCTVPFEERRFVRSLLTHVLSSLQKIDSLIEAHSKNWKLTRIGRVDLAILRICSLELIERKELAVEMILADAAEIGKQYGSAQSSSFVHGVLDGVAKTARQKATL
jgi:N utilization substance protein B